ncbi:MAG: hypothetical protein ACI80F_002853, partial [Natronomonas sp.]
AGHLRDAVGYVFEACPDRPCVEVPALDARTKVGDALAEFDQEVVVGHPRERLDVEAVIEQTLAGPLQHRARDSGDVVAIHRPVHQCARQEERFGGLDVARCEHEATVPIAERPEQPAVVDSAVGDAGVVGVTDEIVHAVDIEFAGNKLAELTLASDEVGDTARVEVVGFEDGVEVGLSEQRPDFVVVTAGATADDVLGLVAVGAVPHVVQERGCADVSRALAVDVEVGQRLAGEVIDAECMLETGVRRRGVDQPHGRQLLDVAESLDGRGVQKRRRDRVERYPVVDGVLDGVHRRGFVG